MARERGDMPLDIHLLHVGLDEATERRERAEAELADVLDAVLPHVDALERTLQAAVQERQRAYDDQKRCFESIKKLGFYVDEKRAPLPYDLAADKDNSRDRTK